MRLQKAPLVTSGLILGLLGLGNLLKDISLVLNAICGIFALFIWVHLLCTILNNFKNVKEQLNTPLVSSVFTTFFMSGFLGTTYLNTYFSDVTIITSLITPLWLLCLMGIMIHMIIFSIKYLRVLARKCLSIMDSALYWYCYCWINSTNQRILFNWKIISYIWFFSNMYCLTNSIQTIKNVSIANVY